MTSLGSLVWHHYVRQQPLTVVPADIPRARIQSQSLLLVCFMYKLCLCYRKNCVCFFWKLTSLFKANKNMTVITNVEHKEQKESLPFVNKTTNQVSLQNLTPALRRWGVQYKKLNATSKRLWPNCDFAMMTDNLSTHNLHTTIQHVEILYDIFLRLECKSGWFIWIFPIEYTIALRIIKFMINDTFELQVNNRNYSPH